MKKEPTATCGSQQWKGCPISVGDQAGVSMFIGRNVGPHGLQCQSRREVQAHLRRCPSSPRPTPQRGDSRIQCPPYSPLSPPLPFLQSPAHNQRSLSHGQNLPCSCGCSVSASSTESGKGEQRSNEHPQPAPLVPCQVELVSVLQDESIAGCKG